MRNLHDAENTINELNKLLYKQSISSYLPHNTEYIKGLELSINELNKLKNEYTELKQQFEVMFNTNPSPTIVSTLEEGIIKNANYAFLDLFGYEKEEVFNKKFLSLNLYENFDDRDFILNELLTKGFCNSLEVKFKNKNGDIIHSLYSSKIVTLKGIFHIISVVLDVTKLKNSEEKYKILFENALEMILVIQNQKLKMYNPMVAEVTGYSKDELLFTDFWQFIHQDDRKDVLKHSMDCLNDKIDKLKYVFKLFKKDKTIIWVEMNSIKIDWEGKPAILNFLSDITERKNKENEIIFLSYNDQLTGLYNRRFYEEQLKRLDTKRNLPLTIVMGDVNGLKLTNDAFGHLVGDKLLKEIAHAIKNECRTDDIVARFGGDEFIVLLPKTNSQEAELIVNRIKNSIKGKKVDNALLSISFGLATKEVSDEKIILITSQAEDNMYRNKLAESKSMKKETLNRIFNSFYGGNEKEKEHSMNVSKLCEKFAISLGMDNVSIKELKTAGLLHDIGKIIVDKNILNKLDFLNEKERQDIEKHPETGYHILKSVSEYANIAEYVINHHEKVDGSGYPKGLKSKDIPKQAKIIAIAEAYDEMINNNYKELLNKDEAIKELLDKTNTQFDSYYTKIFIEKVLST